MLTNQAKHGRMKSMANLHRKNELFIFNNSKINEVPLSATTSTENQNNKSNLMEKSNNCCLVCFDKPPDSVFMDCGHAGY